MLRCSIHQFSMSVVAVRLEATFDSTRSVGLTLSSGQPRTSLAKHLSTHRRSHKETPKGSLYKFQKVLLISDKRTGWFLWMCRDEQASAYHREMDGHLPQQPASKGLEVCKQEPRRYVILICRSCPFAILASPCFVVFEEGHTRTKNMKTIETYRNIRGKILVPMLQWPVCSLQLCALFLCVQLVSIQTHPSLCLPI